MLPGRSQKRYWTIRTDDDDDDGARRERRQRSQDGRKEKLAAVGAGSHVVLRTRRPLTTRKYDIDKDFPSLTDTAKLSFAKKSRKPRSLSECTGTTKGTKPVPEGLDDPGSDSDAVLSDAHDGIVGSPVDLDVISDRMTAVNMTGSPWAAVPASSSSSSSLAVPPPPKCPPRL